MLKKKDYSSREIAIFEAMVTLLNRGKRFHELKVADITAAADMGKGTAYEYFASKEEIMRESIRYHAFKELSAFSYFISSQDSFMGMINNYMEYIVDMMQTRFSSLMMILINLEQSELQQLIHEDNELVTTIQYVINEQIDSVLVLGKKEGLIGDNVTITECRLVFTGIMSSFTNEVRLLQSKRDPKQYDKLLNDLKKATVSIILKALK